MRGVDYSPYNSSDANLVSCHFDCSKSLGQDATGVYRLSNLMRE